jgi:TonB-linked SusC/RagA family outer membrane protein
MRKLLTAVMALLCFTGQLLAQKSITGTVTDDKGAPIPNATVMVKGTNNGTVTKLDGTYSLTVSADAKVLVFSSVDMSPLEVVIGSETNISPSLKPVESVLAEVIMVGYGTQQKKEFTGSASKVDVKEFSNLMTPSVDKQLAGRATGVQVTNSGGLVNSPAVIRIRGINSLTQGNSPLIVVDGIPMLNGNLASATNSNELADINPADIETMDVLKDGSATAIYGSRAAAGVILITTKKGSKGKAKVSYDGFVGFSSALKKFDVLNADQFVVIANEKLTNAGMPARAGVNASAQSFETDWQSNVMIDNAPIHNHTLSIQGGGEKTSYYFSLNYSNQKGIIISNFNKSYRLRMNIDYEANRFLKIGNNISVSRQEDGDQNNGSNALGGAIAASIRQLPNVSPYSSTHFSGYNINYPNTSSMTPGANSQTIDDNFSNVAFTLRNNKSRSDRYHILNNTFLELSPVKGLKFRSQLGVDMLSDYSYQGLSPLHGDGYGTPSGGTNGSMFNANQNFLRLVFTNFFNYNISIKKHNIYLTAGHEFQKTTTKTHSSSGTNISDIFFIK